MEPWNIWPTARSNIPTTARTTWSKSAAGVKKRTKRTTTIRTTKETNAITSSRAEKPPAYNAHDFDLNCASSSKHPEVIHQNLLDSVYSASLLVIACLFVNCVSGFQRLSRYFPVHLWALTLKWYIIRERRVLSLSTTKEGILRNLRWIQ